MRFLLTGGTLNPLKGDYLEGIIRCGHTGTVVYPGEGVSSLDGYGALMLTGGGDIYPERFGKNVLPNGSETFDTERDILEFELFRMFYDRRKPVFGICRGMQVINVALGGTLWQDLPSQRGVIHSSPETPVSHAVIWSGPGGMNLPAVVNSYHHQAVRDLGEGLAVTSAAYDGVIESIEHIEYPIYAVQWHPEKDGAYETFPGLLDFC